MTAQLPTSTLFREGLCWAAMILSTYALTTMLARNGLLLDPSVLFIPGIAICLFVLGKVFSKADKKRKLHSIMRALTALAIMAAVSFSHNGTKSTVMNYAREVGKQVDDICKNTGRCPDKIEGFICDDVTSTPKCITEKNGYRISYRYDPAWVDDENGSSVEIDAFSFEIEVKLDGYRQKPSARTSLPPTDGRKQGAYRFLERLAILYRRVGNRGDVHNPRRRQVVGKIFLNRPDIGKIGIQGASDRDSRFRGCRQKFFPIPGGAVH